MGSRFLFIVKVISKNKAPKSLNLDKKIFRCEECGLHYETIQKAEECENWGKDNKSCNLEIIQDALENKK
ncbi:MAG: hypothetical protein ABEI53_02900 [Candidatus Magasanikbacteria bacterium]